MSDLIKVDPSAVPAPSAPIQSPFQVSRLPARSLDLLWLGRILRKRLRLIALAVAVALVPTIAYVRLATPLYRATVKIQVDPESAKVLPYNDVSDSLINAAPHFDLYMKTQDELLRTEVLLARTTERLRRDFKQYSRGTIDRALKAGPEIRRVEGSQMMLVSYSADDPKLAATVANAWAEEYIGLQLERRSQTSEKASEFLREQLKVLKRKVEDAESDLLRYSQSHSIMNIDAGQESATRQRYQYLSGELARADKDLIARTAEWEGLKDASIEDFPGNLKSQVIIGLETRVFQTEQELTKLLAQFDENWPAVVQKRHELKLVRSQLDQARRSALARARTEAEMEYKAAVAERQGLEQALQRQSELVNQLNRASVEYKNLKRELEASEQLYQGLLQRLKEAGVGAGLELSNIHIADRAQPPAAPYSPRKTLSIVMALMLGLMAGIGGSVALEFLNNTVSDPWDIEQFGLPLLGWVPKIANGAGARTVQMTAALVPFQADAASAVQLNGKGGENGNGAANGEDHGLSAQEYRVRECYRSLCASLLLSRADGVPRTVLVTSATPQEGKTQTSASLGATFAEMGWPTLLIDADFRNPCLARRFNIRSVEGLSTYLAGGRLVIQETGIPNLFILPSGSAPPNPIALFSANRMSEVLAELGDRFKFILIDSPPLLSLADAAVLSTKVAGVILVVRSSKTPRDLIDKAVLQLNRAGSCLLGAVVNLVNLDDPGYSYYRKYYYRDYAGKQTS